MKKTLKIRESTEKYLITILLLRKKIQNVRSVDVARELLVSKASVSNAIKMLRHENLVCMDKKRNLILTDDGLEYAISVFERYRAIEILLTDTLNLDKKNPLDNSLGQS